MEKKVESKRRDYDLKTKKKVEKIGFLKIWDVE